MTSRGRHYGAQWKRLRLAVLDRDLGLCQIRAAGCTRYATEVDHVIPVADGGPELDPSNCRAACHACNARRSAERTNSFRYRDSVARYETRL